MLQSISILSGEETMLHAFAPGFKTAGLTYYPLTFPKSRSIVKFTALCVAQLLVANLLLGLVSPFSIPLKSDVTSAGSNQGLKNNLGLTFTDLKTYLQAQTSFNPTIRPQNAGRVIRGWESYPDSNQSHHANSDITLFFPDNYQSFFTYQLNNLSIQIRAVDSQSAAARVEDGTMAYREVYPQTDSLFVVGKNQLKEFLYLRSSASPTRFNYELVVSPATVLRMEGSAVRLEGAGGEVAWLPAPWLIDRHGQRHEDNTTLQWQLNPINAATYRLTLALKPEGLTYPLVIDPPLQWSTATNMNGVRTTHTTTLLPNGKVLVVGGYNTAGAGTYLNTAEIYDPIANSWANTANTMTTARRNHTATVLPNGKVLVAGGRGTGGTYLSSVEIYDPAINSWSSATSMLNARANHTATLLNNGKVLVAGGRNGGNNWLSSSEIYDPSTNTWSNADSLGTGRRDHTATLLSNGKLLVVGGGVNFFGSNVATNSAEIYDPTTNSWTNANNMNSGRITHTATLLATGKVLVAGGQNAFGATLNTSELFDPTSGNWTNTTGNMTTTRTNQTATLLANGKVLVVGGQNNAGNSLNSADLYDPTANTWAATTNTLTTQRYDHGTTLLANGKVLVTGGYNTTGVGSTLSSSEVFDLPLGSWSSAGTMPASRTQFSLTLLANGKALAAGGTNGTTPLNSTDLYTPASNSWSAGPIMSANRAQHTATLLTNGKVLVAGGYDGTNYLGSTEIYDPTANNWTSAANMTTVRAQATATLLSNGKVLVAGGQSAAGTYLNSAEVYDPVLNTWTATTNTLSVARVQATATLLTSGKVLVVGGTNGTVQAAVDIYDPSTNSWSTGPAIGAARTLHIATLLANGKVLVAGGQGSGGTALNSAQFYDPTGNNWTNTTNNLSANRQNHSATLLPNGRVLVAGGANPAALNSADFYDPATNSWTATATMATARQGQMATILPNNKVLVVGGAGLSSAELYDMGLGFQAGWQPTISSATSPVIMTTAITLAGSQFKGVSEASSGSNQNSSTGYPLIQLRSLSNQQMTWLTSDATTNWSATAFTSQAIPTTFPKGYALLTVFSNAIPSSASLVNISKYNSSITLTSSANPSVSGQAVTFTATVTAVAPGSGTPTGSVIFYDGGVALGPAVALSGGVATFNATSLTTGVHTITALYSGDDNFNSSTSAGLTQVVGTATLVSLAVSPVNPSIAKGTTQQFTVTGTYTDGSTQNLTSSVTWSSSNITIATISNTAGSNGLATASVVNTGTTTITATLGSVTGSTTLTVTAATLKSIDLTPVSPVIARGTTQAFTATGTFSDGTTQNITASVTWTSGNTSVATIASGGVATGVNLGSSTITASSGAISGSTILNVTSASLTTLTLTPANPSIARGTTQQFTATGTFSDGSTQNLTSSVTWSSGNITTATISTGGLATGVNTGTTIITATFGTVSGTTNLTVTAATLSSINLTPASPVIARGTTQAFTATGMFSDNTTQDLTATVTWTSGNNTIATITAAGVATGVNSGTVTITATSGSVSGTASLTVTAASLTSIVVTPATPSIARGTTQQFIATGTFSDSTTQDLTSSVTWSSSDPTVAPISNAGGSRGLATGANTGTVTITAALNNVSGTATLTVTAATLSSLNVTPASPVIARGTTQQFTATGTFSDGSTQDLTASVTWTSGSTTVATITPAGLATGANVGNSTITATLGSVSGSTTLNVTSATLTSLIVTPSNPSIPRGTTQQFTATGTYSDSTTQDITSLVTWASATPAVATISNAAGSRGLANGLNTGSSTITATLGGVSGTTTLTVTGAVLTGIAVTPGSPTIAKGTTQAFTATGTYSDNTTADITALVSWLSGNTGVATISAAGLASGVNTGTSTITATLNGVTGTATLNVTSANLVSIAVTPANPSIALGSTRQFTATGTYSDASIQDITTLVTWTSATPTVATISNAAGSRGLASGLLAGTSLISATLGGVSGSTTLTVGAATLVSIAVTPASPVIARGTNQAFTATGTFSDGSTQNLTGSVTWSSSNTGVATINPTGLASGVNVGTSTITATSGGISGTATLTVVSANLTAITVTPANLSIARGATQQFTATGSFSDGSTQDLTSTVTWSSSNTTAVTISNLSGSRGLASGVNAGTSTITATSGAISGTTLLTVTAASLVRIDVTPGSPVIAKGTTQAFVATGVYSDNTTQNLTATVTWTSSNPTTATISATGVATGVNAGTSTITATLGAISGTAVLTVNAASLTTITVTPPNPSIAQGTTQQFVATGTFSDGTTQNLTSLVTWVSGTPTVATITNAVGSNGLATASSVNTGTSTITATLGSVSGTATLTITPATLKSIAITPVNPVIARGTTQTFTATGTYSDGSTQNLTGAVTWASSNTGTATISVGGVATGVNGGTSTISATLGAISGSTTLTVVTASLTSIAVTPPNPSIARGTGQQFIATGNFSDGSTQDLSSSVTWASTNTAVASISNVSGSRGLANGLNTGSTTISATLGAISGSITLTVTAAMLSSISVTPVSPAIARGTTQQFTATGIYSDNTTQDLTSVVSWASSNNTLATITALGLATGLNVGSVTITATSGGASGSTTLIITGAALTGLTITPANPSIARGTTQQFVVMGTFSDDSTQDLSSSVTWDSTNLTVAAISNAGGSRGLASGLNTGNTTITATLGGISANTVLTVTAAVLTKITVIPATPVIAKGTTQQFVATGTFSDSTIQDLTTTVTWSSSNATIAAISNAAGSEGLATGLNIGTVTITATRGAISGMATLVVPSAVLVSLNVTPANPTIVKNTYQQFVVTGTFSDNSTQDLSSSVTWSSSNPVMAAISNASGTKGQAKGLGVGNTTITATFGAISASTTLTVISATIVTKETDNGLGDTAGTLSFALRFSQAGDTITFALPNNANRVVVSNTLPAARPGVSIQGACVNNTPGIVIDGSGIHGVSDGLVFNGGSTINGLKITGFKGKALVTRGVGNHVSCTFVGK
jgi:N-acetylneuraminic acid mutarotase